MTIEQCLKKIEKIREELGAADCLFRGECQVHPSTYSSHHRIFHSMRFTPGQAAAVKERLLWIAQFLTLTGLGIPGYASPEDAAKNGRQLTMKEVNEVIYSFMQHYHLATPFIDLTTDLKVALAFAVEGASTESASQMRGGVIYVVSKSALEDRKETFFPSLDSRARRPLIQKAVSLFLADGTDFQKFPAEVVTRLEFHDTCANLFQFDDASLYNAEGDRIAKEVAQLCYRCAHEDMASNDSSHGRVTEYFDQIAFRLQDAGAMR